MIFKSTKSPTAELRDLLGATRARLAQGHLQGLQDLGARHMKALERFISGPVPSEAELLKLKTEAQATEAMILAAREGLQAARRRLAEIERELSGWKAYDKTGQRSEVAASRVTLERKA
ncbi:hypothetical protein [Halodurantibacterium flavum]|uniref:Flagellar FliJ protein n=1 Tax=Halodurantibacterium flavum TaxID=1382802 RepID=A0ABW4SAR8_9RHOB